MRSIQNLLATLVIAVAPCAPALSQVVDQVNLPTNGWLNANLSGLVWQQEVTAGVTGSLASVELFFGGFAESNAVPQTFRFFINRGAGWQTDSHDFSTLVLPPAEGSLLISLDTQALQLSAGEAFVIGVEGLGPDNGCCNLRSSYPAAYEPGRLFADPGVEQNSDLAFVTRMIAAPVPEPASILLLGAGLLVLSRYRGRDHA